MTAKVRTSMAKAWLALDAVFQPRTAVLGDIATEERSPHTATDQ